MCGSLNGRLLSFQIQDGKGDVTITNDGATILKQMQVLHPAAKMVSHGVENDIQAGDDVEGVCLTFMMRLCRWWSCLKLRT